MNKKGHVLNAVLLSVGLGYVLEPSLTVATVETMVRLSLPVALGALFPDVDTAFGKHRKSLHNLPVLGVFVVFPTYFANLYFVWVGIATHYVLDVIGSRRGIALFYPFSKTEYGFPGGVTTSSKHADLVTVAVTALEIGAFAAVHYYVLPLSRGVNANTALAGLRAVVGV
ncbi:metal-dependent hydrolase [Haloplanus sp. GCM10025708]|uniref:metal-dependent hydrolase n=1 Tax=Haloferacaceae TaxID=1644056 RepID=UPI003618504B